MAAAVESSLFQGVSKPRGCDGISMVVETGTRYDVSHQMSSGCKPA